MRLTVLYLWEAGDTLVEVREGFQQRILQHQQAAHLILQLLKVDTNINGQIKDKAFYTRLKILMGFGCLLPRAKKSVTCM